MLTQAAASKQSVDIPLIDDLQKKLKETQLRADELQAELQTRMDQINVACVVSEADLKGDITYVNDLLCEVHSIHESPDRQPAIQD